MSVEAERLLDNGYNVCLFKNDMGSYTAFCFGNFEDLRQFFDEELIDERFITDHFTVKDAFEYLANKVLLGDIRGKGASSD